MILRRLGNKKKVAHKIIKYFPDHKIYIEPFFGAGGMFFQKPKAKYNIVNDLDSDVFNLFQVIMNQKEELKKAFYIMPHSYDLFEYWKQNKETDPIMKAMRFLMLSNLSYLGQSDCVIMSTYSNDKKITYHNIEKTFDLIFDVQFNNKDYRDFFKTIRYDERGCGAPQYCFIYADPPYVSTTDNYSNSFTESDSIDLFNVLQETGCKYAMSEFNNPFIIDQAKQRGLNIHIIGERQNLKNRRTEILITNYKNQQRELFGDQSCS